MPRCCIITSYIVGYDTTSGMDCSLHEIPQCERDRSEKLNDKEAIRMVHYLIRKDQRSM